MFGTTTSANLIAKSFYTEDKSCRSDLCKGNIIDERDYVSNFTNRIRNNVSSKGFVSYARVLSGSEERRLGCDAIIVLKSTTQYNQDKYKIGLFEAKWPRVTHAPDYAWDYHPQNMNNIPSHFSSQIQRQHSYRTNAVIWEMFFLELHPGKSHQRFDIDGSSCVRHDPAYSKMIAMGSNRWTNQDLDNAMQNDCENIQHIVQDMIMCQAGVPLDDDDNGTIVLESESGSDDIDYDVPGKLQIPVPILGIDDSFMAARADKFIKENGLQSYLYIDLNTSEDPHKNIIEKKATVIKDNLFPAKTPANIQAIQHGNIGHYEAGS